jgi:integrase
MAYSFARVGAVIRMKVGDYFVQGRRRWVRLYEKGGKEHDVPCHHNLDHYLDAYLDAAAIAGDVDGYLFRTASGKTVRRRIICESFSAIYEWWRISLCSTIVCCRGLRPKTTVC